MAATGMTEKRQPQQTEEHVQDLGSLGCHQQTTLPSYIPCVV